MKIVLLSDTHGYIDEPVMRYIQKADEVWHAGDIGTQEVIDKIQSVKTLRAVYGNIDGQSIRRQFPLDNRFMLNGLDVWITHIGGYPGHYEKRVREVLQTNPPQLLICGHSHILKVMRDPHYGFIFMNPGAAGIQGFHTYRTLLRVTVENGQIISPEAIELGKRGAII